MNSQLWVCLTDSSKTAAVTLSIADDSIIPRGRKAPNEVRLQVGLVWEPNDTREYLAVEIVLDQ